VIHRLQASGDRLQHRRAYGSVQKAGEFAEICRDHAIRFLPSTFAGPNATDIAMAIDAIELVLRQPVDEVVIVSSDMDYSPLIVRLRELGCRVTGYGQQGKSGRDIERDYERVYDQFSVVGPAKPRAAVKRAPAAEVRADAAVLPVPPRAKAPRAPRVAKVQKLAVPLPVPESLVAAPVPRPAAEPVAPVPQVVLPARSRTRRPAAQAAVPVSAPVPVKVPVATALPAAVEAVLEACPGLRGGALVRLNGVAKALRDVGVLSQSGRTTSLFKKLESHFELVPADKPESVRFLGA
jgi:hypothetical protein